MGLVENRVDPPVSQYPPYEQQIEEDKQRSQQGKREFSPINQSGDSVENNENLRMLKIVQNVIAAISLAILGVAGCLFYLACMWGYGATVPLAAHYYAESKLIALSGLKILIPGVILGITALALGCLFKEGERLPFYGYDSYDIPLLN